MVLYLQCQSDYAVSFFPVFIHSSSLGGSLSLLHTISSQLPIINGFKYYLLVSTMGHLLLPQRSIPRHRDCLFCTCCQSICYLSLIMHFSRIAPSFPGMPSSGLGGSPMIDHEWGTIDNKREWVKFWRLWKYDISWLAWWLHKSTYLSKLTELYTLNWYI